MSGLEGVAILTVYRQYRPWLSIDGTDGVFAGEELLQLRGHGGDDVGLEDAGARAVFMGGKWVFVMQLER